jgi:glutamyl-tRNA reductase
VKFIFKVACWDFHDDDKILQNIMAKEDNYWINLLNTYGIKQKIILKTCNRVEIYFIEVLEEVVFEDPGVKIFKGEEAMLHLFSVAAGLESMSVGEQEILRQVKEAYEDSIKKGMIGKEISIIFRKAISVGKEIRQKTAISHGKVSIPAIMIDEIDKSIGDLQRKIGIVGTGKMAATIGRYLIKNKANNITIYGRNDEAGNELASMLNLKFEKNLNMKYIIDNNTVIITATTSKTVLMESEDIERINEKKILVDISNPKNIEANFKNDKIVLINLDKASSIMEKNRTKKEADILVSRQIIVREIRELHERILETEAEEIISMTYEMAKNILIQEIQKYLREVSKGGDESELLNLMGNSLINKILAPQTFALKDLIRDSKIDTLREFLVNFEEHLKKNIEALGNSSVDLSDIQNQQFQTPRLSRKF